MLWNEEDGEKERCPSSYKEADLELISKQLGYTT